MYCVIEYYVTKQNSMQKHIELLDLIQEIFTGL